MEIGVEIKLEIPTRFFKDQFLAIEVKQKLGIRGDQIPFNFRCDINNLQYRVFRSNYDCLFNDAIIYECQGIQDDCVVLRGKVHI